MCSWMAVRHEEAMEDGKDGNFLIIWDNNWPWDKQLVAEIACENGPSALAINLGYRWFMVSPSSREQGHIYDCLHDRTQNACQEPKSCVARASFDNHTVGLRIIHKSKPTVIHGNRESPT
uniref:Aspergillus nuclease S(1) n=1 Tax=Steinernema glaseri TaxID=37863 RepID=A0A1I7ZX12_9BILA